MTDTIADDVILSAPEVPAPPPEPPHRLVNGVKVLLTEAEIAERAAEEAAVAARPQPVPTVTARQLRLWLVGQGRSLAMVDAAIGALPSEVQAVAQIEWEYATSYDRAHPLIAPLGAALGFSPEDIDAGFRQAATL